MLRLRTDFIGALPRYQSSLDAQGIQDGLQYAAAELADNITDAVSQCVVDRATWGLEYWGRMLGVSGVNTIDDRRERIKARLRASGTATRELIKSVAEAYAYGAVDVIEDYDNYVVTLYFLAVGGRPRNMDAFLAAVREVVPAHIGRTLDYAYDYATYGELSRLTYAEMAAYTYAGLRDGVWRD